MWKDPGTITGGRTDGCLVIAIVLLGGLLTAVVGVPYGIIQLFT